MVAYDEIVSKIQMKNVLPSCTGIAVARDPSQILGLNEQRIFKVIDRLFSLIIMLIIAWIHMYKDLVVENVNLMA